VREGGRGGGGEGGRESCQYSIVSAPVYSLHKVTILSTFKNVLRLALDPVVNVSLV
jgi:hypothetical protein